MERVEVYAVGTGKIKVKGKTPLFYQGHVYRGMLQSDRFIGNSTDSKQCLLWRLMQSHTDYWTISTSVIWRVDEVLLPLSSSMDTRCSLLPLVWKRRDVEERELRYVRVVRKKGCWVLRVRSRGALWIFNMLHRSYGQGLNLAIADTFLEGFVERYI